MARRGEAGHVRADLGDHDLGQAPPDAGDRLEGDELGLLRLPARRDLGADVVDALIELAQMAQHHPQDEALVGPDRSCEGGRQRRALLAQPSPGKLGHRRGIGLARHERSEDRAARGAADRGHRGELEVRPLQHLGDAVQLVRALPHERRAIPHEFSQLALGTLRHEARPDQAVAQELGDPLGIAHVGLAARDRLDVAGVGHEEREAALEHVVYGFPERACRLHRDVGDAAGGEPGGQLEQLGGEGAERA